MICSTIYDAAYKLIRPTTYKLIYNAVLYMPPKKLVADLELVFLSVVVLDMQLNFYLFKTRRPTWYPMEKSKQGKHFRAAQSHHIF